MYFIIYIFNVKTTTYYNLCCQRLSHEEREAYFLRLIDAESDLDETENLFGHGDADGDEDYMPSGEAEESDVEQEPCEVEENDESDCDDNDESNNENPMSSFANNSYYETKDTVKWFKDAPHINRRGSTNIIREKLYMGPNPITKNMSRVKTFNCILSCIQQMEF